MSAEPTAHSRLESKVMFIPSPTNCSSEQARQIVRTLEAIAASYGLGIAGRGQIPST
jgi:hypothetical protein